MTRQLALIGAAIAFCLAATANSGGYRYGVSDQAFYATAVIKDLHPDFYPRDTPLLAAESRLMWSDKLVANLSRALGLDLPPLYLGLYVGGLLLLFAAAVAFGRAAGLSTWSIVGLLVLLTFRHRIAKTGVNSLEGYMHPRMLAFACGVFALAGVLADRYGRAAVWTALAACWHPTTAFWFAMVAFVALIVARPRWRPGTLAIAGLAAVAGVWATLWGPLAGRLLVMDPTWLRVLAEKDYLFPHQWPFYAWAANLAYPVVIFLIYRRRRTRDALRPGERPLLAGLLALLAMFAASLPLTMMHIALAVQMQVTRVFWILDFTASAYIAWWWVQDRTVRQQTLTLAGIALLAAASAGRGTYLLSQDRRLVAMALPSTPWVEAMDWLKRQPSSWYVLADPGHAWKYGVSVRLAAEKDTLLETGKDTALAMYDRTIALGVADRLSALRDFDRLTDTDLRALANRYGLDVAVVETSHPLGLPVLHRNVQFAIYDLR